MGTYLMSSTTSTTRWAGALLALAMGTGAPISVAQEFAGGDLDDLRALSPSLVFDDLTITGPLRLPVGVTGNATLSVNNLTVTPSGSIGKSFSACDYLPSPSLTVNASGSVALQGDVVLTGRSGTTVSSGATCNQCTGVDGGNVTINAAAIDVAGRLDTGGGAGLFSVFIAGGQRFSSGCAGGDSGTITLDAASIVVSGDVDAFGGQGGRTSGGNGADGAVGAIDVLSTGPFDLDGGSLGTDGLLTLRAATASLSGELSFGSVDDLIGGVVDLDPPVVTVTEPLSGATIETGEPVTVTVNVTDAGLGVRSVLIEGFGDSVLVEDPTDLADGSVTVLLAATEISRTIRVVATDLKGQQSLATVEDLNFAGDLVVGEGEVLIVREDLLLGPEATIIVNGRLGFEVTTPTRMTAGNLLVGPQGTIRIEDPGRFTFETYTDLTIEIENAAVVLGNVETRALDGDDNAGSLVMRAGSLDIPGRISSFGLYGDFDSSHAGNIHLESRSHIAFGENTWISASGGGNDNCRAGGDGGAIVLTYETYLAEPAGLGRSLFSFGGGGSFPGVFCQNPPRGDSGSLTIDRTGVAYPAPRHSQQVDFGAAVTDGGFGVPSVMRATVAPDGATGLAAGEDPLEALFDMSPVHVTQTVDMVLRPLSLDGVGYFAYLIDLDAGTIVAGASSFSVLPVVEATDITLQQGVSYAIAISIAEGDLDSASPQPVEVAVLPTSGRAPEGVLVAAETGSNDQTLPAFDSFALDPDVLVSAPSYNDKRPAVARYLGSARSVDVVSWPIEGVSSAPEHDAEAFQVLAVEPSVEVFDDAQLEVGSFTAEVGAGVFVRFRKSFAEQPRVFLTVHSASGDAPLVIRARNVFENGFTGELFGAEASADTPKRRVSYLALADTDGSGLLPGAGSAYTSGQTTLDDSFGPVLDQFAFAEEEFSADTETAHAAESVDYLALAGGLFLQDVSTNDRDPIGFRVNPVVTSTAATEDTDGDGILDVFDPDDDNDQIPDTVERQFGSDPKVPDADGDLDGDGVSNLQELLDGTDPAVSDVGGIVKKIILLLRGRN